MILADNPNQRHVCPVTLFLAFAIADNAIASINCKEDFATLLRLEWSGWISLRYKDNAGQLSVMRRTGNKSKTMSSCAMKPSVLCKMMQAQISRSSHATTLTKLLQDARMSSLREKRCECSECFVCPTGS
jgi:hypothetical protein